MSDTHPIEPGLMVLHGNRLEDLRDILVGWLRHAPLRPLEDERILVQSNGIAQWFRLALARAESDGGLGIAASVNVELPGRFLWDAYRAVLGREAVPPESPFDKSRLIWRLMRLLPALAREPIFEPLAAFLGDGGDARKCHQLAERLADLYDGYQVYRADWLDDWAAGRDVMRDARGGQATMLEVDRWQAALWQRLLDDVGSAEADGHRAAVHARFLEAAASATERPRALARRIVVFGMSSLPRQTIEALSALSRWSQVVLVVLNPCRHYWADIVDDRELLRAERRRQQAKPGVPSMPDEGDLHLYANPLLAAWGKQGRDYIRMLDEFDHPETYRKRFTAWDERIDFFEEPTAATLLGQVQGAILDLDPLPSTPAAISADDQSIAFHVAHGPQREVEILHDQLLARFEASARTGDPMLPRDVIVMVPDIDTYAPHIDAVFGRVSRDDPRYVPYSIADRASRGTVPMVMALDMLMGMTESRFGAGDMADLLDVPALRQRFGLGDDDLPLLHRWVEGAGIRWGLDAEQRASLGLPALEQNTWLFGLRRMLLGYAVGQGEAWGDIEPYGEVGGLDAELVGPLADLVERLGGHWRDMAVPASAAVWGERLRALLRDFFDTSDPDDAMRAQRLLDALEGWERACAEAAFDEPVPVDVVREAWLGQIDDGGLSKRFLAGAVSFGTLMPMRAIPFRLVCLLGMNDGDYPRARPPMDFDLMARAGAWRPGDRSRREDDRYLFLEAVLSARDALHIGWVGRSARDNAERAPSVLVGQLRDYLSAAWRDEGGASLLHRLTVEHPLQPFSREYFRAGDARLFTYANEWRHVHDGGVETAGDALPAWSADRPIGLATLRRFLRHPVREFFQARLGVRFEVPEAASDALEPFALDGLDRFAMTDTVLRAALREDRPAGMAMAEATARLQRSGMLPMGGFAAPVRRELEEGASLVYGRYIAERRRWPVEAGKFEVRVPCDGVVIEDWLAGLRANESGALAALLVSPTGVLDNDGHPLVHRVVMPWVDHLVAQVAGHAVETRYIGPDGTIVMAPMDADDAHRALTTLVRAWCEGMGSPLPVAMKTALAWISAEDEEAAEAAARRAYSPSDEFSRGEIDGDPYLARAWPDFDAMLAAGFARQLGPYRDLRAALKVEQA
ncbi:exodeoxyribonuclease V subunit gamma [Luteibacter aegosomaticola]|uniref:exodeoxyribonuclease V subunit gamma n=1 Tax=Luteibacter aegosomaticola TaxID=2911538 RepID=UPI001FF8C9EE|nr:exodeoxyribonuclease V subunit gamma [Luteibacter aegosomaticola]UPG91494.1 exodeoxyribonuclease V subunit gamma [Luteibacter aegosomaticola]